MVFSIKGPSDIMIGYWNIHGVKNKIENELVINWIKKHDIVVLSEVKTALPFTVPGYIVLRKEGNNPHRGGTVLIVKNSLDKYMKSISCEEDQIWFNLSFLPHIHIGGCYIPPRDSPYYDELYFAKLQEKFLETSVICFGDFNSRCGIAVKDLCENLLLPENNFYDKNLPDPIERPNENGERMLQLCKDSKCVIVNNLHKGEKYFKGSKTFRKRDNWISEIDLAIASLPVLDYIEDLHFDKNLRLPSDHSPLTLSVNLSQLTADVEKTANILSRAAELGDHAILHRRNLLSKSTCRKGIQVSDIETKKFVENMETMNIPDTDNVQDIDDSIRSFSNILYECSKSSKKPTGTSNINFGEKSRWKRILELQDDKVLWQSINWKGQFMPKEKLDERPSDHEFKQHFESFLNPEGVEEANLGDVDSDVSIPYLDNPITISEVDHVIKYQIKPNKGCGPDGISPGLFKLLPAQWILYLTMLLNIIFSLRYPTDWYLAKLTILFKKGCKKVCDNYRGISVISAMSKIYDYILYNRLKEWFIPDREQAGAQSGRGCIEHIVTLRLIMDTFVKKKLPLYVVYVDFSKAYDRIPRCTIIELLKELGCGAVMLKALAALYRTSKSCLRNATITSVVGVRQGSPISCFIFVLYVNKLIRWLKETHLSDGFLSWLHCLMFIDDTIILATSKDKCIGKVKTLLDYCQKYGMVINEKKTKYMAVGIEGTKCMLHVFHFIWM